MLTPRLHNDLRREVANGFDVLHLESLWSGWLGLDYAERAVLNLHYLFSIDLADRPTTSVTDRLRRYSTQRAERQLLRHYPRICTVSPRLSRSVRVANPAANVHTIPLGLELSLYPFNEENRSRQPPVLGLIGSFHWQPTYSAGVRLLTRLWPEIKRRVPAARLQIVGRRARTALADFANLPDVEVHEDVPDTIPYFLNTSVLLYAPSRGSGMKVKILEAFALGVPVVTTGEGVEGIPAIDGLHAGIAEDDAGLIDRAVALLNNSELQEVRRRAARELVESHCSPGVVLDQLENVYTGVTGATPLEKVAMRPSTR
jgi:glycosyltransferase involved in cell wall biosynthesis